MINNLKLENFRNHNKAEFLLGKTTIIIGKNGVGKSNILEALSVASCCRSFRDEDKKDLVNHDSEYARIVIDDLDVFIQKVPKLFIQLKNRGVTKKKADYVGILPSVIFSPETLQIITSGPKERRRFLDVMISQINKCYLRSLISYEKAKLNRNNLLQLISVNRANQDELSFWDEEIVKHGMVISFARREALSFLEKKVAEYYKEISDQPQELKLIYETNVDESFGARLRAIRGKEIAANRTLIGPHRDDFLVILDNREMAKFTSRGEIRSAVLSLKIAELDFIKSCKNDSCKAPILLLDDVFSEFDESRRKHLFKLINDHQAVITTTDREFIDKEMAQDAVIIELVGK